MQDLAERIGSGLRTSVGNVIQGAAESLPAIVAAVAVLVIAWVLAAMTQRVVRVGAAYVVSPTLRNLLRQVAY